MKDTYHIALVTAFPPSQQSLNEYGYHLALGFAENPKVRKITIIADHLQDPDAELDLSEKIEVKRVWQFNRLRAVFSILQALRSSAPDGVIWNLQTASFGDKEIPAAAGLLGPALARIGGIPSGVIAHNIIAGIDLDNTQLKGARMRQAIVRTGGAVVTRALMSASYCTVTLRGYLDILQKQFPKASVHLVPHGTFETEYLDVAPIDERPKRIVTMGKFGTYKRLDTLIEAFKTLKSLPNMEDLELVIGGSDHPSTPGYMAEVEADCASIPSIKFHGYIAEDDIPDFFSTARVSIFDYSTTTGSSGVLHQTASYGCVPVFPHIGDFVDLCRDEGLAGRNYEPNDAEDMARAIHRALNGSEENQALADQNLKASRDMPFSDVIGFHLNQMFNPA